MEPMSAGEKTLTWKHSSLLLVHRLQDENASVSGSCCAAVRKLGQNPKCLCAVMHSRTTKSSGVKPEIAMTILKR
ncbi:putative lipid-transfer protein DIR1 [Helianthus anomalus]